MKYSQRDGLVGKQTDFGRFSQLLPNAAHFPPRPGRSVSFTAVLCAAAASGKELRTACRDSVKQQQEKHTNPKRDADAGSRHCPPHYQLCGPRSAHDIRAQAFLADNKFNYQC